MKTVTIKFTQDFYCEIPRKKTYKVGETLPLDADEENFPTHSFWQSQFKDGLTHFEIVGSEVTPEKLKKK